MANEHGMLLTLGSSNIAPDNRPRQRGVRVAAYLILERAGIDGETELLMLQRANTGYMDGQYSFVAGHVEFGEPVTSAMIREAKEEAGIKVSLENLHFAHTCLRMSEADLIYHDFFFRASKWHGQVVNMEPERCSDLRWFSKSVLPKNTIPYIETVIKMIYSEHQHFSEYNWESQ